MCTASLSFLHIQSAIGTCQLLRKKVERTIDRPWLLDDYRLCFNCFCNESFSMNPTSPALVVNLKPRCLGIDLSWKASHGQQYSRHHIMVRQFQRMDKSLKINNMGISESGSTCPPMDTSAVYQVNDHNNSEKVCDSVTTHDVSLSPSKHRRSHRHSFCAAPTNTTIDHGGGDDNSPTARFRRSTTSFGRLKVQRVQTIPVKSSIEEEEINKNEHTPTFEESVGSQNKSRDVGRKKKVDASVHGERVLSSSHVQELTEVQIEKSTSEASVPGGFTPQLRGWTDGRSSYGTKSESLDLLKQRKFSTNSDFFSRKSFRDLCCSEYMIECLKKQFFQRPSHIQAMAFRPVIEGKSCILADQSGSGKTLAYLAPLIQRLREEEVQGLTMSSSRSPRILILVPTAELAAQVLSSCRSMSRAGIPFRSMVATGGFHRKTQLESLQEGIDVLIATPGRYTFLVQEGFLHLSNLRCAVLDEVDILYNDDDFGLTLQSLINSSPVSMQYLFVTATLPVVIYNKLVETFPDCEVIMGPGMHRISSGLEEILVDCSGDDKAEKTPETAFLNKKSALLQLVEGSSVPKTIVFCNKIETCRKVENVLRRFDRRGARVQVLPFHAAVAQESRVANMKEFTNSSSKEVSQFLVCTDRASRGIDFSGVDHVVLFDFPRDPSEYVRRVGRTARGARGKGKAFIFVVGKQVSLARRILERNRKGHPLHDVPSAYELSS